MAGPSRRSKGTSEKPKDIKKALKRITKELHKYYLLIIIAVTLSTIASIIAIFTPNMLSNITDKITVGLSINTDNIKTITEEIKKNQENGVLVPFEIDGVLISVRDQENILSMLQNYEDKEALTKTYGQLPDDVQKLFASKIDLKGVRNIAIVLLSLYLISALFNYIESITMTDVSNKFGYDLRKNISTKINRLPLKYFDRNQIGDVLSRVSNDVDTLSSSMNNSISTLISSITLVIGVVVMMFITNWILAITAILSSLLGFILMSQILKRSQKHFDQKQIELGNVNGHIEEVFSGLNVVKAYNAKEQTLNQFRELNTKLYTANWLSDFLSGLMPPIMNFIGDFSYIAVCVMGAYLAFNGYITFGTIIAFILYARLFASPLSQIASALSSVQSASAASERVFSFLDEEEMPNENHISITLDKNNVKGNIEFKNVQFKYDGNEKPTIKDFSAKVLPGQKIAIVGPTGAGKTTMVNLLMKFYDIDSGDILINGVSIKELSRSNIHDLFTMVLQDTWIFEGTIADNIRYSCKNVDDEMIESVCRIVGLDHFIRTLSNGYNTKISDNNSISAGQRQLLTIARGMIKNAPFLILDEATSNVDTRTEELVQKAMDEITKGRTSFIIAHRLSTIKNADLILVMKDGNIVEQGNHQQLMKKKGFYADLYNSQFEL